MKCLCNRCSELGRCGINGHKSSCWGYLNNSCHHKEDDSCPMNDHSCPDFHKIKDEIKDWFKEDYQ